MTVTLLEPNGQRYTSGATIREKGPDHDFDKNVEFLGIKIVVVLTLCLRTHRFPMQSVDKTGNCKINLADGFSHPMVHDSASDIGL